MFKRFLVTNGSMLQLVTRRLLSHSFTSSFVVRTIASMTGYTSDYVSSKLKQNLNVEFLDVVDVSDGCGAKFECVIVSENFDGKPMVERHRMVNTLFAEELKTIHAFSMRTLTPAQWQRLKDTK